MGNTNIAAAIKSLENGIKELKQMAGIKDDDADIEDLEQEPLEQVKEIGRGRKKRKVPTMGGAEIDESDTKE